MPAIASAAWTSNSAGYILEHNKPAIFVVNKWDLVKDVMDTEKMGKYVRAMFPSLEHVPIAFVTARRGRTCCACCSLPFNCTSRRARG